MARVNSGPRRGVVLAGVILLHAGLVAVVVIALRSQGGASRPADLVSTLIFLNEPPPASPPPPPEDPLRPGFAPVPSTAITLPPMRQPGTEGPVDWHAEAQGAGADLTGPRRTRPLDHNPATAAAPAAASPAWAVHHAGEQYRDADGTSIVFVSDHCFVASAPAPLGTPDVIARARPTRTVCKGDPGWSRADLFNDLPAYERYHRLPPPRP